MSYRGGYSVAERRDIERKLMRGDLLGVVATNALELGIDIGELGKFKISIILFIFAFFETI